MPAGSLPGRFVAFAWLLAVATPLLAQAGLDARQSAIHVYRYDDNDFERYIHLRDTATGLLPYQTAFAQRFVLAEEGTVQYVEICVRKPQVVSGPSADVLVYITEFWSDAGNVPGERFHGIINFTVGVPPGYRTCHKVYFLSEVTQDPSSEVTLDAGPLWVTVQWGDDPEDPNSHQDLAVDEDNSGGRRAFRVIHEEGDAWQAWQVDTDPRVYAIRLAVEHSDPVSGPDPPPEPESPGCESRVAPYWHGTGGFAVRPADGASAMVRIECAGRRYTSREHAGEDGLIVRTVSQPMCMTEDGQPIEGEMTFEGIDGDGWYWVNGDRNVAVAPLVCESQLSPELRPPVPGGVTARPSGDRRFVLSVRGEWHGTLMVHDESGFMGIVPHLVDLEGGGEHVAPYWKGGGGVVGRPLDGLRATVRLACRDADAETLVLDAGEDGLIAEILPGCFDEDGAPVSGRLEADGLEDGAWYWLNIDNAAGAAPLLRRSADVDVDVTTPVLPAGVNAEEGPLGTLFSRGPLMGVVPRVGQVGN